jgi:hypothetical protein
MYLENASNANLLALVIGIVFNDRAPRAHLEYRTRVHGSRSFPSDGRLRLIFLGLQGHFTVRLAVQIIMGDPENCSVSGSR